VLLASYGWQRIVAVHRNNLTQLKGNRLQIYTRGDTSAVWWHARTRDPNGRGYLTKSMKTTDQAAAIRKAEAWHDNLQFQIDQGLTIKPRSVDQVCDIYIKELEEDIQRGDRPKRHLKDYKTLIEKYVRPYFRQRKVDAIRQRNVDEFIRWRKNYYVTGPGSKVKTVTYKRQQRNGIRTITRPAPKPPSTSESALGTLATVLRGVFDTAVRHDAMLEANVPSIKSAKRKAGAKKSTRRPAFDKPEYDRLVTYMRSWCKTGRDDAQNQRRMLLRDYVLFLVNSGLRPGTETDALLWKHISEFTGTDRKQYLKISVTGKTGTRTVVPMERAKDYLDRIKQRQITATGAEPPASQHVFATPDGKHVSHDSLRSPFCSLLAEMNMETDNNGDRYVLYSCRHTYATFRLMNGEVEIKTLA
jgi:hypothetical protein